MRLGMTASLLACVFGAGVAVGALTLEPAPLAAASPAAGTHHTATAPPGYGTAGASRSAANQNAGAPAQATLEVTASSSPRRHASLPAARSPAATTVALGETGAGLDGANFSLVEGVDGGQQLKAGTWPLYRFAGDAGPR